MRVVLVEEGGCGAGGETRGTRGKQGGRHKRATQSVATARGGERGSATLGGDGGDHRHRRHAPRGSRRRGRRRARQEASQRTTVHVTQHLPSRPLLSSRRVVLCSAPAPPPGGSTTSDLRVVRGRRAARKFGFSTFGAGPADFVWRSVWRCPTVAFSRRFPDLPLPGAPRSRGEIRRRGLRALERAHVSCGVDGAAPQQCSSRDPRGEKAVASSSRARCRCCRSWARSRLGSPDPPRASPRVPLAGYPSQLAPWVPWWCAPRRTRESPREEDEEGQGEEEEQDAPGTLRERISRRAPHLVVPPPRDDPIADRRRPSARVACCASSSRVATAHAAPLTHPSLAFQEFIEKDNEKDQLAAAMREAARSAAARGTSASDDATPAQSASSSRRSSPRFARRAPRFARRAPPPPPR